MPIGNVTSQIFANIYLNELDQFSKHALKVKHYFRYADDFVTVGNDAEYLICILEKLTRFLEDKLLLQLHPQKVEIRKLSQGIDFLGYVILPHHVVLRTKSKRRMFKKLWQKRDLLESGVLPEEGYYQSVQSYFGAIKHCDGYELGRIVRNEFGIK